jgi:hypothetical protein
MMFFGTTSISSVSIVLTARSNCRVWAEQAMSRMHFLCTVKRIESFS